MTVPHPGLYSVGMACWIIGTVATGVGSVAGKVLSETPDAAITANDGIRATVALGVIGLLTQVVNGVFAGRKLRKEVMDKLSAAESLAADAIATSSRLVADAKAVADRKIADALALADRNIAEAAAVAARNIADAAAEAARKIADAAAESDRLRAIAMQEAQARADVRRQERELANARILELESRLANITEKTDRLGPRIETAARGIDANSAGLRTAAAAIGIEVPTAVPMDGGRGVMDPVPKVD